MVNVIVEPISTLALSSVPVELGYSYSTTRLDDVITSVDTPEGMSL